MADPVREQAVAAAVLERGTPTGTVSPERQRGQAIRAKMQAEGGRSVIQNLRERGDPIVQRNIDRKINSSIGTRQPDGTMLRNTTEQTNFTEATDSAKLAKEYLDKRYEGLSSIQQDEVRSQVVAAIGAWPEAQVFLNGLSATEKKKAIETILKNPDYAAKLRAEFKKAIDREVPNSVQSAQEQFSQAQKAFDDNFDDIAQNAFDSSQVSAHLDQFKPGASSDIVIAGIDEKALSEEIEDYKGDREDRKDEMKRLDRRIKTELYKDPSADVSTLQAQLSAVKKEIRDINKEIQDRQDQLTKKQSLINQRGILLQKQQELQRQRGVLEENKSKLQRELFAAQASLATAKMDRTGNETDFLDGLQNVFAEATMQYIIEVAEKAEAAEAALTEDEKKLAKDAGEKGFIDQMSKRWDQERTAKATFSGAERRSTAPRKDVIKADLGTLLNEGPDPVIREMLRAGGMADTEADAKMKDSGFMDKARSQVAEKVLGKYMKIGGKLSNDEADKIFDSEWGEAALRKAFDRREAFKAFRTEMQNKGVIRNGSELVDMIKQNKNKLTMFGLGAAGIMMIAFGPEIAAAIGTFSLAAFLKSLVIPSGSMVQAAGAAGLAGAGISGLKQRAENA